MYVCIENGEYGRATILQELPGGTLWKLCWPPLARADEFSYSTLQPSGCAIRRCVRYHFWAENDATVSREYDRQVLAR